MYNLLVEGMVTYTGATYEDCLEWAKAEGYAQYVYGIGWILPGDMGIVPH